MWHFPFAVHFSIIGTVFSRYVANLKRKRAKTRNFQSQQPTDFQYITHHYYLPCFNNIGLIITSSAGFSPFQKPFKHDFFGRIKEENESNFGPISNQFFPPNFVCIVPWESVYYKGNFILCSCDRLLLIKTSNLQSCCIRSNGIHI